MLIVWKGGASRINLTEPQTIGVIIGVGAAVAVLVCIFFLPYLYCKVVKNDVSLKWWHIFMGPLLLQRPTPPGNENAQVVQNYYRNHQTMDELMEARGATEKPTKLRDPENPDLLPSIETPQPLSKTEGDGTESPKTDAHSEGKHHELGEHVSIIGPRPEGKIFTPAVLFWQFKRFFFRGVDKDIVSLQGKRNILTGDLELMHAHAAHYNNKVEYMYSFLQVMTAATASFTHGANDVSKYASHTSGC